MQSLFGTWKLVEARAFDKNGNELAPPYGPNPMGIIQYAARRLIVAVSDGRPVMPSGGVPRAYVSYTGAYEFDGEILVTHVDGASSPEVFTDQVRQITFPSDDCYVAVPLDADRESTGFRITWDRIK